MESIIFLRIKDLCKAKGISINKLETEVGMSQYSITRWKTSNSQTVDKLLRVARYFDVSLDYLAGNSNIPTSADALVSDRDMIDLLNARERMSEKDKQRMMGMLRIGFDYAFSEMTSEAAKED